MDHNHGPADEQQTEKDKASVRFLQASSAAGNVDIFRDGKLLIEKFPYRKISSYASFPSGALQICIYPAECRDQAILCQNTAFEKGLTYTLALIGTIEKLQLLRLQNDSNVPAGESKIRFLHLGLNTPSLDIAVKNRDVVFPDLESKQVTDYLGITPMTVDLEARLAGEKTVVLPLPKLKFSANQAYTIALVEQSGQPDTLEVMILTE